MMDVAIVYMEKVTVSFFLPLKLREGVSSVRSLHLIIKKEREKAAGDCSKLLEPE